MAALTADFDGTRFLLVPVLVTFAEFLGLEFLREFFEGAMINGR